MDAELTQARLAQCRHELERNERREYPQGFPALPPVPAGRYIDPRFFALENQFLWPKSWLYAGFANEVPEPGSYKLWERCGVSIVITRGDDLKIRAFYNSCRHRGGALVKQPSGQTRNFVCKFHGWAYELDGRLKGVPLRHEFCDLSHVESGLLPLRCEMWGNLIFINRDLDAAPLLDSLGPLVEDFKDAALERRVAFKVQTNTVRCNWKIMLDAFAEAYHLPATHPKTVNAFSDYRSSFIQLYRDGHSAMYILTRPSEVADSLDNPTGNDSGSAEHRITRETILSYTVFPNIILTKAEFQYAYIAFWPEGIDHTVIETVFTAPEGYEDPESPTNRSAIDIYNVILGEDIDNLQWLQKSVEGGAVKAMPLSYGERRVYQIAEEIDRRIGPQLIPAELRVKPVLTPHYEDPYAKVSA